MALIKMDALPRKRTRYLKSFMILLRVLRCKTDFEELDAEDDDIISRAVTVDAGYFNMPA